MVDHPPTTEGKTKNVRLGWGFPKRRKVKSEGRHTTEEGFQEKIRSPEIGTEERGAK